MSLRATSAVWARSKAAGNDLLVLLALADYVGRDDDYCWPSQESLAEKTRLSLSTVRRCVRSLEKLGEIVTGPNQGPRYENARRPLNTYRLAVMAGYLEGIQGGQSDRSTTSKPVKSGQITGQNGSDNRSAVTSITGSNGEGKAAGAQRSCPRPGHEHAPVSARYGCTACRVDMLAGDQVGSP